MENIITKKSNSLKCGSLIKPLLIISLVCTVLSCITYFFYDDPKEINGEWVYELSARPLSVWSLEHIENILSLILTLAPIVLLVLYIFKFHSNLKATVIVPIIFGILGLNIIFDFLFVYGFSSYGIYRILDLAILVCSILAVISALKGFNKKVFVIIAMSVCLLREVLALMDMFAFMHYVVVPLYLYFFTSLLSIIGAITLYTALLLFGLKNKIPSVVSLSPEKEKARAEKMNPEQALKLLKDKLDLDMITEEEYQAQRAEIISKL